MNWHSESLLVHFRRVEHIKAQAVNYQSLKLNERQLCDLELLCNRAFYPLNGFLNRREYESVLESGRLPEGWIWPLPICLDVPEDVALNLEPETPLSLLDQEGFLLAILHVEDVWRPDKRQEAQRIFGTEDETRHPSVFHLYHRMHSYYAGGRIEGIHPPPHYDFPELRIPPSETHRLFTSRGWRNVIGFHTEKPLHCAHKEMILEAARKAGASIFVNPVIGIPSPGDLDHFTMVRSYQAFVEHFPKNIIQLGLLPFASRKAGPKEALLQALIRKNYGCTHFMVAPDHADPFMHNSNNHLFYPVGEAQELLRENQDELSITCVELTPMVYVQDRAQYLPEHQVDDTMEAKKISSSELRRRLEFDLEIPEWFSFPDVVRELKKSHPPRHEQGLTIFLTGLSGAGKSTLARILYVKFMEMRDRPVTLLDGDIVRRNLSSELDYSRKHREINVRRIGFVASEITKNRGIAICAPIAPYEESRRHNRELIEQYGGYIEVYLNTPLSVCENRDRKGIYAKAKQGIMKGVTGIDDPYIPPSNPEIALNTSEFTPVEAAQQVLLYLEEQGYIK
ncbi:MAG: bifunctional sulfate adenylyltransferase/adenylylsulfate kinase [Desulfohalobiaceae bacterium]|nr:bifunctional sulfate adenylyltransferase/adenylylsulfate kinase [Desulfohalobiaceae bacterium]